MALPEKIHLTKRELEAIARAELTRRRRIGDAHRGTTKSPEWRQRISEGLRRTHAEKRERAAKTAS